MMRSRKPRILIVDDEEEGLKLVEAILAGPYHVRTALGGQEALAAAEQDLPDLFVIDLMMPGVDGFEVCRRLRRWTEVPIVVLSGRDRPHDKVRALDLGADDFVSKPFNIEELLARVRAVLRRTSKVDSTSVPTPKSVSKRGAHTGRRPIRAISCGRTIVGYLGAQYLP